MLNSKSLVPVHCVNDNFNQQPNGVRVSKNTSQPKVNQKAVEAFELLIRRIERIESDIIALQSIKVGTQSEMEDLRESVDGLKENMKDIRIDINKKK